MDDTEATMAASTISTTKSTYSIQTNPSESSINILKYGRIHFISFHFVSFNFFALRFFFIAYFSILGLVFPIFFPHSLLTLLHSDILNLRFNIMLCTFSLVLYYTYFFGRRERERGMEGIRLFSITISFFLLFKPQHLLPSPFEHEKIHHFVLAVFN